MCVCVVVIKLIGTSLSEPHLVTTAVCCLFIYHTSSTRDQLLNICTVSAIHILVPRTKPSFPGLHLKQLTWLVWTTTVYKEDLQGEAIVVAISSLEVPSICDSTERSPTCARGSRYVPVAKHLLSTSIAC